MPGFDKRSKGKNGKKSQNKLNAERPSEGVSLKSGLKSNVCIFYPKNAQEECPELSLRLGLAFLFRTPRRQTGFSTTASCMLLKDAHKRSNTLCESTDVHMRRREACQFGHTRPSPSRIERCISLHPSTRGFVCDCLLEFCVHTRTCGTLSPCLPSTVPQGFSLLEELKERFSL